MGSACTRAAGANVMAPGNVEIREFTVAQTGLSEADLLGLNFLPEGSLGDEGPKDDNASDKDEEQQSAPGRLESRFGEILWVRRTQEAGSAPRVQVS
mmetsp:Transcript_56407/g.115418  ORF Transcript_56407/g.115418 Transcript_56407/m.115418 type:complete len:97 (+) Transcript_56407:186-476(+)|eukprot:CAMPEP_0181333496 /NCGR_PEP_ID=MMETSP1101-20121128/25709_1 /TAXON_ID=46948 /ORGANISM="Rhodomonas abbreviata, Strain Caron Lab Isolate" /LENGTH=96 /DNA_ID=CAMNT_0023443313 /DNA_START=180 /DNA_END=470 /DNA_ORIENTATION=-